MTQGLLQAKTLIRTLDHATSQTVLTAALDDQASIRFYESIDGPVLGNGTMRAEATGTLTVDLSRPAPAARMRTERLMAGFSLKGTRYSFQVELIRPDDEEQTCALTFRRPKVIDVIERRRSARRAFRRPNTVSLAPFDGQDEPPMTAAMLNVSGDGMACRLESSAHLDMAVGQTWSAGFTLDDALEGFELPATIVSMTPSPSKGSVVVGLEFTENPVELKRLRSIVERQDTPSHGESC